MSNDRKAAIPAMVFAALGDLTRLELVSRLSDGKDYSIAQLADGLALSRQGVTKHLLVMKQAGIVSSEKVGREMRFTIISDPLEKARNYLTRVSSQWDDAIERLSAQVGKKR